MSADQEVSNVQSAEVNHRQHLVAGLWRASATILIALIFYTGITIFWEALFRWRVIAFFLVCFFPALIGSMLSTYHFILASWWNSSSRKLWPLALIPIPYAVTYFGIFRYFGGVIWAAIH